MFSDCLKRIVDYVNGSAYLVESVGVKMDCALWNETRNEAESSARFPLRLYPFGWTQSDGAGAWRPVYHFAIIGKMKRGQEMDATETDFSDVCELIGLGLHQKAFGSFSVVATKGFIFNSAMTITSDNRRVLVNVAEDEIAFANFFWASQMSINDLAATATDQTVSPYDISVAQTGSGNSLGNSEVLPPETISALVTKTENIGKQVF